MISVTDARRLQKNGTTQEEHLHRALLRTTDAITDVAKHRKETAVAVVVFKLTKESLEQLADDIRERGFMVKTDYRDPDRSVISIAWGIGEDS